MRQGSKVLSVDAGKNIPQLDLLVENTIPDAVENGWLDTQR
jgi:hypothetical protein